MKHEIPPIPNVSMDMTIPHFWLTKESDAHKILVENIEQCNASIAENCPHIVNIYDLDETIPADTVRTLIGTYKFPENETRFDENGERFAYQFYDTLRINQNLSKIPNKVNVRFGFSIQKTCVRAFPTWKTSALRLDNLDFDRFQECEHDAFTPVAVVHTSADGLWVFARTPIYFGWMPSKHIVFVEDKHALRQWCEPLDFLLATGSHVTSACGKHRFMMGTRVPRLGDPQDGFYSVRIAESDENGFAKSKIIQISALDDVSTQYLPCTLHHQLLQLFKMQGEPYSWGGREHGRDCTRVIVDTFRCFGIRIPRNSGEQRTIGKEQIINKEEIAENAVFASSLAELKAGTLLYSDGHAMTFLGNHNGRHYIIHSFSGHQHIESPTGDPVFGMHVTDLSIIRGGLAAVRWARRLDF